MNEKNVTIEKLREADERLQIIIDANPHINILFNDRFEVIECNPAALKFMGFETKQELFDGFLERIIKSIPENQSNGQPSVPLTERFMSVVAEGSADFQTDLFIDETLRTLDVNLKKIPYGDSFAIVGYLYDMTAIHKREMEFKRAQELIELQLIKLNMAVLATKISLWDMEIEKENPANPENTLMFSSEFRKMLGFTDESDFPNVLRSWLDRLHPEDFENTTGAFRNHVGDTTDLTPFDVECRLLKKNNEYSHFRVTGKTIRDEHGEPIRAVGTLMDITESKNILLETERQRIEAEAASMAKSAFLSTMSHEIRTPMNAILGITEFQLQDEKLDKSIKEALGKIYASGDMLLGIINDMLDLSKIESGKIELLTEKYELASLISDTAQLNMMRIGSKPIEFELNVDENAPANLMGDELRVKQILNNILSNAFKYTARGKVKLSITPDPNSVDDKDTVTLLISVSDTGQGMTKEQVDQLFDEYSRFNMKANRATEGTGLGMSITRNLVHLMNGSISVESEPDKGSTFTVSLPQGRIDSAVLGKEMADNLQQFRTSGAAQMKRVQITREPMPYGKVLIVDDVETNIFVARGLLSPYELTIDFAESGFAAIKKIDDGNVYDIIFMDHMMPQMDGIEATQIIRNKGYDHPIVALTANAVSGQADVFLKNGFDDFISKPIDIRQLNIVLNRLIRDRQPPEVIEAARRGQKEKTEKPSVIAAIPAVNPRYAEVFARDARKSLAALEPIMEKNGDFSEDDIKMYTIHVHGMKSALASIGFKELSEVARSLEKSVRNGNLEAVSAESPAFIDALRFLVEELAPSNKEKDSAAESENLPNQI